MGNSRAISALVLALVSNLALMLSPVSADDWQQVRPDAEDLDVWDPIEPVNRGIFWFNDRLDVYVAEPVARGYDDIMPDRAQQSVGNFFYNLRYPRFLVSDVVQLKFSQALTHTARFLINSTIGVAGLFEVAEEVGLKRHDEDFGTALGYYDVPPGPYLVLPILGPSNLRDAFGRGVDVFLDPFFYAGEIFDVTDKEAMFITYGGKTVDFIDQRADLIEAIESAKDASLDYYLFAQSAYTQYRRGLIYDGNPPRMEPRHDAAADPLRDELDDELVVEPAASAQAK